MSSTYGNEIEISTLVVKLSSRCNMNCDYCYIYNSKDTSWKNMPKIMPQDVATSLVTRIADMYKEQQTKPLVVFHGGEPLLAGISYLRKLTDCILKESPNAILSIQSNGTIYNKDLEDFLTDYRGKISFSISVDGFKKENDLHRKGLKEQSVYEKIERTIFRSSQSSLLDNILLVIDINNNPERIFDFMESCQISSFNIILPDGDYNTLPENKKIFDSTEVGEWLWVLFKKYGMSSNQFRIKFFDDIAKGILEKRSEIVQPPSTFSSCTLTVDTNGDIKQSDIFRINGDGADSIGAFNVKKSSLVDVANSKENIQYMESIEPLPPVCLDCKYLNICGGGYPNHRLNGNSFSNPSIYCKDYKYLFEKIELALCQ